MKNLLLIAAVAAALAPFASQAESNFVTTTGSTSPAASAKLDFKIVVPKVLFLQVGAAGTTVNKVTFDVPANDIGNSTPVAGIGDDLAGGAVTVRVLGNIGDVNLTNTTVGQLTNGVATILWSDITGTPVALADATPGYLPNDEIEHPVFNETGTGFTALAAQAGLVRREGSWKFKYANASMLPAGTYNGQATYTVTAP